MKTSDGRSSESDGSVWDFAPSPVAILAPLRLPVWGRPTDQYSVVQVQESPGGWSVIVQHKEAADVVAGFTFDRARRIVDSFSSPYEALRIESFLPADNGSSGAPEGTAATS